MRHAVVVGLALVLVGCASGEAGTPTTSGADSPPAGDVGVLLDGVERIHRIPGTTSPRPTSEWRPASCDPLRGAPTGRAARRAHAAARPARRARRAQRHLSARPRARRRAQPASRASVRVRRRALRRGRYRSPRSDRGAGGGDRRSPGGRGPRPRRAARPPRQREQPRRTRPAVPAGRRGAARARGDCLGGRGGARPRLPGRTARKCPARASSGLRLQRGLSRPLPPARSPRPPRPARASIPRTAPRGALALDAGRRQGRLRRVQRHPRETSDFADELRRQARRPTVERVVLDLRHNPGGDNTTFGPLLEEPSPWRTSSCSSGARPSPPRPTSSSSSKSAPTRYSSASPREEARTSTATRSR